MTDVVEEGERLLEKSGNNVPEPLSAARRMFRFGALGAMSLCTVGNSPVVACFRIGLNLGDTMLGDRFINMDDDAFREAGAGTAGTTFFAVPNRGRLLALDGAGSGVELFP